MTIDFTDAWIRAIIRAVDMNHFAAEVIARERLDRARAYSARRRLLRGSQAALALAGS